MDSHITDEEGTWKRLDKSFLEMGKRVEEIGEEPLGRFDLYYDLAAAVLSNDKFQITGGAYSEVPDSYRVLDVEGTLRHVYYRFSILLYWDSYKCRFRYGRLDLYKYDACSFVLYKVLHYPYYPQDANLGLCSDRVVEYLKEHVIKPEYKCES